MTLLEKISEHHNYRSSITYHVMRALDKDNVVDWLVAFVHHYNKNHCSLESAIKASETINEFSRISK